MKEYRVRFINADGKREWDHIFANNAQEAADKIRNEIKNCYILVIAEVVGDWK